MRSIRTILFTWFAIMMVGLFAVTGGVLFSVTQKLLTQFFIEDNSQALGFIAQNIRANYASNLRALDKLATLEGLKGVQASKASEAIQNFLESDNLFGRVELYGANGDLLVQRLRDHQSLYKPKDNLFKEWDRRFVDTAKQVFDTGKAAATPTFRHSNGQIHQSYMVPVFQGSRVAALLVGAVYYDQHQFGHFMEGLKLGHENFLMLTDVEGDLLAQDGLGSESSEIDLRNSALQPLIQQASRTFYYGTDHKSDESWLDRVSFRGQGDYDLMALPIEPFRLILILGANDHTIVRKIDVLLKWMFATLALALVLSFSASGVVSGVLSKPFLLLIRAHERLHRGDLSVRVEYDRSNEIGLLCDSFNRLTEKIDKARLLGNLWGDDSESSSKRPT